MPTRDEMREEIADEYRAGWRRALDLGWEREEIEHLDPETILWLDAPER